MITLMLNKVARLVSLWLMKTAYKGANSIQKQQIRAYAATKSLTCILDHNRELSDLYWEFYNWICSQESK